MESVELNLSIHPSFWKGKKVLLTGHSGFKGNWLTLWLSVLGAQVIGYSLPQIKETPLSPSELDGLCTSIYDDIRNFERLSQVLDDFKPDIVVHMAAQALVHYGYAHPIETYTVNILGTLNLLELIRKGSSVKVFLNVTTDKCYENKDAATPFRETDSLGGSDPYSSSKACSELISQAYAQSYFSESSSPAMVTARAGNVIGGGDWSDNRLIPDIIKGISECIPVEIRYPHAVRPWQFVLDPLKGYLMLAEQAWEHPLTVSGSWNFGPSNASNKTVEWVVQETQHIWDNESNWRQDESAYPKESTYLSLDCTKAHELLNWSPQMSITDTLAWTVSWYKAFYNGENMLKKTREQICFYQEKCV